MTVADVSVIIRTIGRPRLLADALQSLHRCRPAPAEVVVVDQSDTEETAAVVAASPLAGVRLVRSTGRGHSLALNEGLQAAAHDTVLVTDDDCTVAPDWIGVAVRELAANPEALLTGQVLPAAPDARTVPSTIALDEPRDYSGQLLCSVLYTGNMVGSRRRILGLGGFDERIREAAEDCDFCYRWLREGRPLLYVPELRVWHHDWRSGQELISLHAGYHYGQGMFYAKHLRAGDLLVLRFIARDLRGWLRSLADAARGVPRWADARRGMIRGLQAGLRAGWRAFG